MFTPVPTPLLWPRRGAMRREQDAFFLLFSGVGDGEGEDEDNDEKKKTGN